MATLARLMLMQKRMTETELILRDKCVADDPWFGTKTRRFWLVDSLLVLAFLAAFLGLVFALSK
jgi:hypothetical protein